MKNFIQEGKTLTLTAPSGGVVSGAAYLIGGLLAIAVADADEGDEFEGMTEGVFELAKKTSDTMSEGDPIYWDVSEEEFTTTASTNYKVGTCVEDAGSSATTVKVKLCGFAVVVEA